MHFSVTQALIFCLRLFKQFFQWTWWSLPYFSFTRDDPFSANLNSFVFLPLQFPIFSEAIWFLYKKVINLQLFPLKSLVLLQRFLQELFQEFLCILLLLFVTIISSKDKFWESPYTNLDRFFGNLSHSVFHVPTIKRPYNKAHIL